MSFEYIEGNGHPIKAWTRGVQVEDSAKQQLLNLSGMPFIHKHIAAMPDVHWGMGATVGSVIATKGAIIPAAVGVDIGCGMMALQTSLTANDLPDNLHAIRTEIEVSVPHGRTDNGGMNDRGAWGQVPGSVIRVFADQLYDALERIVDGAPNSLQRAAQRADKHLGTLGTGNHFIEICLDEQDRVWIMLHSGSRGIGNAIGRHFIELAKREMERWFVNLPDKDLAYIPEGSEHFDAYMDALDWAQEFARINRVLMMDAAVGAMMRVLGRGISAGVQAVNCHHNYVAREHHFGSNALVTRKGAVRAREGDLGIIPGSMGAKSFIVRGKGNPESFCSCSHGAGRAMSRAEARRRFTVADHEAATAGIECRKDEGVIDETPAAYKGIYAVMHAQEDLVDIVHTLHQVVCVKG